MPILNWLGRDDAFAHSLITPSSARIGQIWAYNLLVAIYLCDYRKKGF